MRIKKGILGLLLVSILFMSMPISVLAEYRLQQAKDPIVIVIDPGHGGENEGTIENGFQEKTMTLVTAQAMYDELSLYDNVEVYLTRTEDVELSLKKRAEYAASVNADFLFSIHYNASVNHNLFGSEVWISAKAPYNGYGYQFGYVQLSTMKEMGLHLRGIKTRLKDDGVSDYYGIIRESVALSVPAVIIEHCHVDQENDSIFCDTDEELIAFGKADALSVAKYFGLKSTVLGVDYSDSITLPQASEDSPVRATLIDETEPDVCVIELGYVDNQTGEINLQVTAADYDSPLIYYDYSVDGGKTYSKRTVWPESDALKGTYKDTFSFSIEGVTGIKPDIIFRAYNMYDGCRESNRITLSYTILQADDNEKDNGGVKEPSSANNPQIEDKKLPGTTTFMPATSQSQEADGEMSFIDFLMICLFIVIALFVLLLISSIITYYKRKKRRRQRRKELGNNRNHPR